MPEFGQQLNILAKALDRQKSYLLLHPIQYNKKIPTGDDNAKQQDRIHNKRTHQKS